MMQGPYAAEWKEAQVARDNENLRLLSIFHYVLGAVLAVMALIPLVHLSMGVAMVTGAFPASGSSPPPPDFLGWIFVAVGGGVVLLGETLALLIVLNGLMLSRRRHFNFCVFISALECLNMPLGTVLGVFSLIMLFRPTVRESFEGQSANSRCSP